MPVSKELIKLITRGFDDLMAIAFDNNLACLTDIETLKDIVSEENLTALEIRLKSLSLSEKSPVFHAKAERVLTLIKTAIASA